MSRRPKLLISVYTGDRKYAGTNANAFLILHDEKGNSSDTIRLNKVFRDNFERGCKDTFNVWESQVSSLEEYWRVDKVEFWKDDSGFWSDWYVDKIAVENVRTNTTAVFPVFRWVRPSLHYFIKHLDTSLPQDDEYQEQRENDLQEKRANYRYYQRQAGLPVQSLLVPREEDFSTEYKWGQLKRAVQTLAINKLKKLRPTSWKTMDDILHLYSGNTFPTPRGVERWKCDVNFGLQRISGLNNSVIKLCTKIPVKFPVTEGMMELLLEELTLQQALDQKRLFLCDLHILEGVPSRPNYVVCAPMALFFLNKDGQLVPVAIQLFQRPGPENPIFLPDDDPWLWEMVKMWYNNADATCCQLLTHVAFTHMLMEGVALSTHRQLAPSHPVFKLLAPHFLYHIANNSKSLAKLFNPKTSVVETATNLGLKGMTELIKRGVEEWRLDTHGTLPEDLKRRGLHDPSVLPCFVFRDDAMLYYDAIHKYVLAYVTLYYESAEKLTGDLEIQNWVFELTEARHNDRGGCGLLGVPGEGSLTSTDQLVTTLTSIIYTCTVAHASASFSMYDQLGYPPNYPLCLRGQPPKSKEPLTEADLFKAVPDRGTTLDIMLLGTLVGHRTTPKLGDFETQYIFDPKAIAILEEFRRDLVKIGEEIKARNERRAVPFHELEPDRLTNSICI